MKETEILTQLLLASIALEQSKRRYEKAVEKAAAERRKINSIIKMHGVDHAGR